MPTNTLVRSNYRTGRDLIGKVFADIGLSFSKNPITGALGEVRNEVAVAQMMQCLILTNIGSWPFEYGNGSRISSSLFEPNDTIALTLLSDTIQESIAQFAPMVNLVSLQVIPSPAAPDDAVLVSIFYQLRNVSDLFNTRLVVDRRIR